MTVCQFEMPEEWVEAADEMDVTYTEYVRRMTRAGRRQMGYDYEPQETPTETTSLKIDENDTKNTERDIIESFLLRNLSTQDYIGTEEIVELLENEIAKTAEALENEGKLDGSVSAGGWRLKDQQ